ncbi:D-alanyl-D-alanine carboxypeptidase [Nonomuraea thailandensis]|uniref:D-alanyl-D-alanine carboxypeptidase n=1 Tax=Nonomuraea thailandensis TaxID=1188745 RepID=A0A9X2GS08_9ACTN|nr:serine hydrolase domain-containing protein [Nonomuraea thailandensis]MCP2364071.1 D-alanyl-D-alanine carboxypeptidase [Nonomuraea thailandensis]
MIATSLRRWTGAPALALAVLCGAATQATAAAGPALDATLDELVTEEGFPAALAAVQSRDGRTRHYTAGLKERPPANGYVRIGSNTKTFTAVTVLQLVGEGKVKLDARVETYLPGLLRGSRATVRQVLQHTSGLPEYTDTLFAKGALPILHRHYEPRQLLGLALRKKPQFAPGAKWAYSNTNYIVAGLLIEKVTGHRAGEEITRRTVDKLGLTRTYFPADGDRRIRRPHPTGYHRDDPAQPMTDVTEFDPSQAWTAGQMISTPGDLNRFFTALLDGRLLKPAQLKEMRTTVPAPQVGRDGRYGLGLSSVKLSCGVTAWGHGGAIPGYYTSNAATEDGRAAAVAVTHLPASAPAQQKVEAALDTAICAQR